jgi:O-antigen/teichoic acid export membrane protein
VVSSLAQIFVPMSSQSDAAGNMERLRKILIVGNRACAFVTFPITAIFVILGKSIIEAWVGEKYVAQAYPVLLTLIIPCTLMMIQGASSRILFGMGKHGKLAAVSLSEGIANLVLSILLVRSYGILGDAFGTAIPMLGTYLVFLPYHLCARLGVRISTYIRDAYLLPAVTCAPLVLLLLLMQHWFVPHGYKELVLQLLAVGMVYVACLAWVYLSGKALRVAGLATSSPEQLRGIEMTAAAIDTLPEDV